MLLRFLCISLFLLSGCLRTREDLKAIESANMMRDQVSTLQKDHADSSTRLEELLDQNRNLNGRIEELEHRLSKNEQEQGSGNEGQQKSIEETKKNNEILQEGIEKLETQIQALQEEIVNLRSKDNLKTTKNDEPKVKTKDKDKDKEVFEGALANFQDKKWKEAILTFDQYREKHPKGKFVAEATYKTGVCFQELSMNDEAKVFYQEVLSKFPQSEYAKKSQYRLKTIK